MTTQIQLRPASIVHRDRKIAETFSANDDQVAVILNSDMGFSLDGIHSDFWRYYDEVRVVKSLIESGESFSHQLITVNTDVDLIELAA
jgi:hypothetical protein